MINKLEQKIMAAAVKAQREYIRMSDGWWLHHAPESFLQIILAQQIGRLGHAVYIDASVKKVKKDLARRGRGRPAKNSRQRADISVWNKADDSLRAAIEVKRAWSVGPVKRDASKLKKYLNQKGAAKAGYILVYSEAKRRKTLLNRFRRWARDLGWESRAIRVRAPRDEEGWVWGFGLIRSTHKMSDTL